MEARGINTPVPKSKIHSSVSGPASKFPLLIILIISYLFSQAYKWLSHSNSEAEKVQFAYIYIVTRLLNNQQQLKVQHHK